MNWSESRKSQKSTENANKNQRMSTTLLNTPSRQIETELHPEKYPTNNKKCPYHFNQLEHICLTCRRSICLRCAITYC